MEQLLNKLNNMQKEAVLKTEGAVLLLAGAGSGKTRVLTHRIAYLINKGVRPFNILAITFTNKAAKEMKERVLNICEEGNQVLVSTFHSLCVRILRRDIDKIGYTNKFTIYDADDTERVIKEIMKEYKINDDILTSKAVMAEISRQKDKLINAYVYEQNVSSDFRKKLISDVYKAYENRLKTNNSLDFDDLIFKTVELFANNPDVLQNYQDRFKYIMVDEYQDTSTSQYTLIKMLANKYKNICVVGDDDQSIYGWRGADINNILDFEKDFENATVIKLEQNYRSSKNILNAANFVIKNNFGRKEKTLWTENQEGDLINYEKCNTDREEANFIANEILTKVNNGSQYKDFAILYRTNNLSRVLEEQLVFLSIPYKLYGGVNFYSRKEIKDIISYLKVIENNQDDVALKRIINVPKRGIGESSILKASDYAKNNNICLFDALKNPDKIPDLGRKTKSVLDFALLMEDFSQKSQTLSIADLIDYILEKTGYIDELKKEGTDEALGRISNLEEFVSKAVEYEEKSNDDEEKSLTKFLEEVSLVADIDSMEDDENVVTLMTVHSSKGLEFDVVFLAGFEEGIFPTYRAITSPNSSDIEEERRLLYVAITRAKKQLYLTNAKTRLQHGRYINNAPSQFFKELPKDLLHIKEKPKKENTKNISFKEEEKGIYRPKPTYKPNISAYIKKDIPAPKNITLDFTIGDTVRHFKFGQGQVLKIEPAGADYEVTISFDNFGDKKLMANLSKLKKV